MSEEEKKVIEECKIFLKEKSSSYINYYNYEGNQRTFWFSNLEEVLNLLEKQQKQNEELEKDVLYWKHQYEEQVKENEELTTNQLDIKDKCIKIAKKLEEDNKPLVAEYILAQVGACPVWDCGEPYCNYIPKSKISEKIEELRKLNKKQTDKEVNKMRDYAIEVLSELF